MISQDDLDRFRKRPASSRVSNARFPDRSRTDSDRDPHSAIVTKSNVQSNVLIPTTRLDTHPANSKKPFYHSIITKSNHKHYVTKRLRYLLIALAVVAAVSLTIFHITNKDSDPIPIQYRKNLSFSVYYPIQSKLPPGYSLNSKSYTNPIKNILVYAIDYKTNHLNVALQVRPPATALHEFVRVHLPLNKTVTTALGTATIGVLNNQAVASIPTSGNTWIIISGPTNVNQQKLIQVINSLTD